MSAAPKVCMGVKKRVEGGKIMCGPLGRFKATVKIPARLCSFRFPSHKETPRDGVSWFMQRKRAIKINSRVSLYQGLILRAYRHGCACRSETLA